MVESIDACEKMKILQQVKNEVGLVNPFERRVRYFISRREYRRVRSCPVMVLLVDFDGKGENFYQMELNADGGWEGKHYDGRYLPGSDVFALQVCDGKLLNGEDAEEKLREFLGF